MSAIKKEDLMSDVEPLPASPSASPPPSFLAPSLTEPCLPSSYRSLSPAPRPSLSQSWPTSPLSTLAPSSQVTARLYASLKSSEKLGMADPVDKPRQVTFSLSSPSLPSDISAGWMKASPSRFLGQLEVREGTQSSTPASLSPSIADPAERTVTAGDEDLELGELAEKMSLSLQTSVEHSSASVQNGKQHIEDMENVRSHLQTMLRAGQEASEPERGANYLSGFTQLDGHGKDDESFDSDATSHLLSAPVVASSAISFSGLDDLFPRYSRLRPGGGLTMSSESQVLQDCLDRERTRRKHCERQIRALQTKVLQLQQQLALAVSADRKKNVMIEQLDKTLAKVVEGWRRHEEEQNEAMRRLQEEKETAVKGQARQQEAMQRLEQSLSQAVETLDREQKRGEELKSTNQLLERQIAELHARMEEQSRRGQRSLEEARKEAQEARGSLAQQREIWDCRGRELEERLALQAADLDKEKGGREREAQQLREAQRELRAAQTRLQQLDGELEESRRERDSARMERALEQARLETQRSQLEVELKLSVEQQVTERLAGLQKENAESVALLREQHRKQLLDLSAHQERELSNQLAQFRAELQERDDRQRRLTEDYERRLCLKQEEVQSLESSRKKLDAQRVELVTRLQGLMQSHWAEALRLLANQDQHESARPPPSPPTQYEPPLSDRVDRVFQQAPGHPQLPALLTSRETSQTSSPDKDSPCCPQKDLSSLLNHSSIFCPLEAQLDDTVVTASGGCDLEELCEKPLAKEKDRAPGVEHGGPWKGMERGLHLEGHGIGSSREESSGYGVPPNLQGLGAYRGDRGKLGQARHRAEGGVFLERDGQVRSGPSAPSGWELGRHVRREDSSLDLSRGSLAAQGGQHSGLEDTESRVRAYSSQQPMVRQSGGPRCNTGASGGALYSTSLGSSLEDRVSSSYSGTSQHLERSIVGQLGAPEKAGKPGEQDEYRQAQLQYYINKLLDRCPGEPLDPPFVASRLRSVTSSCSQAQIGLSTLEGEGDPQPSAVPMVTLSRPPSSAVTITKLRASPLSQASGPFPQGGPTRGSLTSQQLAQVTRLLSECQSQPDSAMPSLEKLLTKLLTAQEDRGLGLEAKESNSSLCHREQNLSHTDQKEVTQRRSHLQRPREGGRNQIQASKGRRGGPQAQRASVNRGSVWR